MIQCVRAGGSAGPAVQRRSGKMGAIARGAGRTVPLRAPSAKPALRRPVFLELADRPPNTDIAPLQTPDQDPIVQRLGHRPFTAVTRVRIPLGSRQRVRSTFERSSTALRVSRTSMRGAPNSQDHGAVGSIPLGSPAECWRVRSTFERSSTAPPPPCKAKKTTRAQRAHLAGCASNNPVRVACVPAVKEGSFCVYIYCEALARNEKS